MSGWLTEAWSRTPRPRAWSIGATIASERSSGCCCLPHQTGCCHRSWPSGASRGRAGTCPIVPRAGASLGSCSQTVISLWHSRLFGDNRPQTGLYPRCREGGGAEKGDYALMFPIVCLRRHALADALRPSRDPCRMATSRQSRFRHSRRSTVTRKGGTLRARSTSRQKGKMV